MPKVIAIATTLIFLGFAPSTHAQSAVPQPKQAPVQEGSAATLQGVEARSININFNVVAPGSFELPTSSRSAQPTSLPGLESIEIKPGLEGVNNPSNVYPVDNSERGGGVQVLYRINQR